MRHAKEKTTLRHYVKDRVHSDVVARWEMIGYEKLGALTSTEILRV